MKAGPAGAAVLAIDGGNSKTDIALVAADGTLLASVRGGGSNHQGIGTERATQSADRAGPGSGRRSRSARRPDRSPMHTSACLAGRRPARSRKLT